MKLLLDTHILIWWFAPTISSLSEAAYTAISDNKNLVFVSAATAWGSTIKKALGKLDAPDNLEEELARHRFQPLPITISHALAVGQLPRYHKDPFDRILVAQAKVESLTLVTRDEKLEMYDIPFIAA